VKIKSFAEGQWVEGAGEGKNVYNAVNGEVIGQVTSEGIDFKGMLDYARMVGNKNLRNMTFHERGRMLKALAKHLMSKKDKFYPISFQTGATKADSWVDIEGGISTLFTFSSKARREMPDQPFYIDGKPEPLSKNGTFIGHHICTPLDGVAIHINAFNFPIWGMLEKLGPTLAAGMPAIIKPASATSYLTEAMVKEIIESKILPEGALQLISGSAGDLLEHVNSQDVVTFTGSEWTGKKIRETKAIKDNNVRFNMEVDSLNCSILGDDASPDTPEFSLFVKEVVREMTTKAGQKCTAIRRTIVPQKYKDDVIKAINERLLKNVIGNPLEEGVRMGSLASIDQRIEVDSKVKELMKYAEVVSPPREEQTLIGGDWENGAFYPATLLYCDKPFESREVHDIEAFGPVSTVMGYKTREEAIELAKMGNGSLVASIFTGDDDVAKELFLGTANHHGRIMLINEESAKESTGHGSPLPHLVHGGPGRAGGGEELGGTRSILHYMQRTAIQGSPTTLSHIAGRWLKGAKRTEDLIHPFKKHFEDLKIGDSLTTHKRTVTETDIVNFANISGDNFYAHTDITSLDNTLFEGRVAHGYFVLAAAAGLFVEPKKGPVLANYGIDELRFTAPVYVNDTIYVHLTVLEKINQEDREGEIPRGIVKWDVEVLNQHDEVVANATILTLVAKK
jgi:oxepin-CoA hydrolase/3-oxo-5,6-dehydrosuberyl-CoA semialdehyde dehydrogenase